MGMAEVRQIGERNRTDESLRVLLDALRMRREQLPLRGDEDAPDVELKKIDGIRSELFADQIGVLENVVGRKNVVVFVLGQRRRAQVCRRNLRRRVKALAFVAGNRLSEKTVAFALPVGPRSIKEVAAETNRKLQGFERLLVVRATPSAHAPKSGCYITDFNSSPAKLPILHLRPLKKQT